MTRSILLLLGGILALLLSAGMMAMLLCTPLAQSDSQGSRTEYVVYIVKRPGLDGAPSIISDFFYSTPEYAGVLMQSNGIEDDRDVDLGRTLRIPILPDSSR